MTARVVWLAGLTVLTLVGCSEKQKAAARLEAAMKSGDTVVQETIDRLSDSTRPGTLDSAVAEISAQVSGVDASELRADSVLDTSVEMSLANRETTTTRIADSGIIPDAGAIPIEERIRSQQIAPPRGEVATKIPSTASVEDTARPTDQQKTGGYVVQVISTPDEREANGLAARLQKAGFRAFVTDAFIEGTTYFRVRVGRYDSVGEAEAALGQIHEQFQVSGFVAQVK